MNKNGEGQNQLKSPVGEGKDEANIPEGEGQSELGTILKMPRRTLLVGSIAVFIFLLSAISAALGMWNDVGEIVSPKKPTTLRPLSIQEEQSISVDGDVNGDVIYYWTSDEIEGLTKDEVIELVNQRLVEEGLVGVEQTDFYYKLEYSEEGIYMLAARHEIQEKIKQAVNSWGGGWAGHTLADFDVFLELAEDNNILSKRTLSDYYVFDYQLKGLLDYYESGISESDGEIYDEFRDFQMWTWYLSKELDEEIRNIESRNQ